MTTTAILAILAALVPLVVWLVKRKLTASDDRNTQLQRRREQIAREIVTGDERAANRGLDDDLHRLRDLQSHQRGQGGSTDARE
jgi:hypothetical protein